MSEKSEKTTPKWRPVPPEMTRMFDDLLTDLPLAERRQMFGCPCAFVGGQMFAGLHQENMMLRLAEADRAEFLGLDGARPFEPMDGRPMREYVTVPPALLASPEQLGRWLERAFQYAASLPPKEKRAAGVKKARAKPAKG
jgi:TfoX/Sxy family transcriptional regulator of competence genes